MIRDDVTKQEYLSAVERGAKTAILQALGQPSPDCARGAFTPPLAALQAARGNAPRPAEMAASVLPAAAQKVETAPRLSSGTARKTHNPCIKYFVKSVKVSGKEPEYVGCNLESTAGQKLYLRFILHSIVNAAEWGALFASFIRRLGLETVTDSEQLVGRHLYLQNPNNVRNVQSIDGLCNLLGFGFHHEHDT